VKVLLICSSNIIMLAVVVGVVVGMCTIVLYVRGMILGNRNNSRLESLG
jgi:hypothetical protein